MRIRWGLILKAYVLAGVVLTLYGFVLTGCTSGNLTFPEPGAAATGAKPASAEEARAALRAARTAEYEEVWNDDELDPFTRALVAFRIAQETEKAVWSSEAVDLFGAIVDEDPFNALALAYLGSAHSLVARDYPIRGALQVLPGPGFVRLYHVRQAFKYLNDAVEQAPRDPVVRLIRGSTFIGLSTFGGEDDGLHDFELLQRWVEKGEPNPDYQDIVDSREFQVELWFAYAGALERLDRDEEARAAWKRVMEMSPDEHVREFASWKQK